MNIKQVIQLLIYKLTPKSDYEELINSPKKGDVVIDCGAYVGDVAEKFSVGGATVYAFEPNPHAFRVLKERFKDKPNVVCLNKAVWDRNTTTKLYLHEKAEEDQVYWSMSASLISSKVNVDVKNYVDVDVVNIVDFIKKIKGRIKILKVDIEGAEYEILDKIIKQKVYEEIDYIFVETHENRVPGLEEKMKNIRKLIRKQRINNIKLDWD